MVAKPAAATIAAAPITSAFLALNFITELLWVFCIRADVNVS
jgi:hypothetical protein